MKQQPSNMSELWQRFADKKATPAELEQLLSALQQEGNNDAMLSQIEEYLQQPLAAGEFDKEYWVTKLKEIMPATSVEPAIVRPLRYRNTWWAVAASVILLLGLASYLLFPGRPSKPHEPVELATTQEVEAPKSIKAEITLADGRTIAVDSLTTLNQNNVVITKTADGKIIYTGNAEEAVYNTLTNPKGSKVIDMTLSDGSRVWLNAGSSLRYPAAFVGNERAVVITGEAYFEVTHDAARPFKVGKDAMQVTVLGTHFNVNAYDDEAEIKTTLLEGSVKVSANNSKVIIKPGQQALLRQTPGGNGLIVISGVAIDEVMAWKNGLFAFKSATLQEVMRQAARWYDVEVIYEGNISNERYRGDVQRSTNLSQLMRILELNGVMYKIEGKKITVRN